MSMSMTLFLPSKPTCSLSSSSVAAASFQRSNEVKKSNPSALAFEKKDRIKKMFDKVELSASFYDTAWVAMVPSPNSPQDPFFHQCVNWLLENQLSDGSWGHANSHPLLVKDALLSTLATVLALKRWGVGEEQINKGLLFVERNFALATDEKQLSPVGFEVIFPTLIEKSNDIRLNIAIEPSKLDALIQKRELELKRAFEADSEGNRAYLAYISEGIGKSLDWEKIMKYQRKNGSLFHSPATTAFAYTNLKNADCLNYLCSVLERFGNAVPTVYPFDMHVHLSMVDSLQRLGIDRHFKEEIRSVLDETYRCWVRRDDSIFVDTSVCATAFRLLRVNGFDVSPDLLDEVSEDHIVNYLGGHMKDIGAVLEVYRASEFITHPDELVLEKHNFWTSRFLQEELSNVSTEAENLRKPVIKEVMESFKLPYHASLERLSSRRAIENYDTDNFRILKASYSSPNVCHKDVLRLAVEDFNACQAIHQEELKNLARWVIDNRLDKLKFVRQKLAYCYFSAATTLFAPELSDARISWAKNGVLTTVVDDFFDVGGSEEELLNLIELVEKWDVNISIDCCSEQVEIIFSALHGTISKIGAEAFLWQGRSVTDHIIEIWLALLKSMLREAQWLKNKTVPTMDEYMDNAYVSFALGPIVLPALYLVGPKLSDDIKGRKELHHLFRLMSTMGRLLNDIQTFKRESEQGKLNSVSLSIIHGSGYATEEEAVQELKSLACSKRKELLRVVLQEKDSVIPRACKDLFWKMSQVLNLFYAKDDGFTSNEMISVAKGIIEEPVVRNDL